MKDKDWLYLGLGAAAIYLVYRVSNSKTGAALDETGAAASDAATTYVNILNPATEYQWGKDAAAWFWDLFGKGGNTYINNWGTGDDGKPKINPEGSGWGNTTTYKGNLELNRQGRQVYAGDFTSGEIADWGRAGWVQSGAYMVAPSLVAEQDALAKKMISEKSAQVLASMNKEFTASNAAARAAVTKPYLGKAGSHAAGGGRVTLSGGVGGKLIKASDPSNAAVNTAWKKIAAAKQK